MFLSIVIPAYNESKRIESTLKEALGYFRDKNIRFEIIVVNDGSTDPTSQVVVDLQRSSPEVTLKELPRNRGKGFAVKTGMLAGKGDVLLFADADGSTPFEETEKLLRALEENSADIAIGSRALYSRDSVVKAKISRKLIGRMFNFTANLIAVPGIKDTQCGFKLFKREVATVIFSKQKFERFSFDIEILRIAQLSKFKIIEVPVNWHHVGGSKVNVLRDGIRMFLDTIKIRFAHR